MRRIDPDDLPLTILETSYRLGKLVVSARKSLRLSQETLCAMAKVSRTTLNEIEKGSPRVQFVYWLLVMDALELLGNFDVLLSASALGRVADTLPRPRRSDK
jgi:transcriptional regulator with XRE-family HTH domain